MNSEDASLKAALRYLIRRYGFDRVEEFLPSCRYDEAIIDIEQLHLPAQTYNALWRSGVLTIEQLKALDPDYISKIRGIGDKGLDRIYAALAVIEARS